MDPYYNFICSTTNQLTNYHSCLFLARQWNLCKWDNNNPHYKWCKEKVLISKPPVLLKASRLSFVWTFSKYSKYQAKMCASLSLSKTSDDIIIIPYTITMYKWCKNKGGFLHQMFLLLCLPSANIHARNITFLYVSSWKQSLTIGNNGCLHSLLSWGQGQGLLGITVHGQT